MDHLIETGIGTDSGAIGQCGVVPVLRVHPMLLLYCALSSGLDMRSVISTNAPTDETIHPPPPGPGPGTGTCMPPSFVEQGTSYLSSRGVGLE